MASRARHAVSRPTVRDVAAEAKVAVSTASAVLRADRTCYASEGTRSKVVDAAERLGYRPNHFARALRGQRSFTIGLLFGTLAAPTIALARLAPIERVAWDAGYRVIFGNHYSSPERERAHIEEFLANRVDGLILVSPSLAIAGLVRDILEQGVPLVTIDSLYDFPTPDVSVDREEAGRLQVEHAYAAGRSRFVFLAPSETTGLAPRKMRGFEKGLAERGSSFAEHLMVPISPTPADRFIVGAQALAEVLARGERFDAVIVAADSVAVGAMQALHRAGLRVPEDVAVIGFDDEDFAAALPVPLTTVHQPRDVGARALAMLLEQFEAQKDPSRPRPEPRQVLVTPRLVVRESTVSLH